MLAKIEARGEQGIRGWDGWMASPMQWTWTWANSRKWGGTGRPGVLQSMGPQRVGHNWATEQQQRDDECLWTYWGNQFTMSASQIIMLYTVNLYSVVCQLSLKSLEGKKVYFVPSIVLEGYGCEREEKNWKRKERSQLYWTDGTEVKNSSIKALSLFLKILWH